MLNTIWKQYLNVRHNKLKFTVQVLIFLRMKRNQKNLKQRFGETLEYRMLKFARNKISMSTNVIN